MNIQVELSLPHKGAVLFLHFPQDRIIASSQQGGTTVVEHACGSEEQNYTQQSNLELGEVWDTACLGEHLVAGNRDGILRLWSLATKENIRDFHGHEAAVRRVIIPDERTLISSDNTGVIRVWKLPSGECRHVLTSHDGDVTVLASHGEVLISGGSDNRVRIWNLANGQCVHLLEGHESGVSILGWNEDHTLIVTGGRGGALKIWRISDGKHIANCVGHTKIATNIIDHKGQLITASADGTIREWDWQSGQAIKTIEAHSGRNPAVRAVEFFGDGSQMVTAGMDGKVKLWDYPSGRCTDELLTSQRAIWIGKKLGEYHLVITVMAEDHLQHLKILRIGS